MTTTVLTKQYILDAHGSPIGVILPIEQYEVLIQSKEVSRHEQQEVTVSPLFGALQPLAGDVAPTAEIDQALDELWSTWNESSAE